MLSNLKSFYSKSVDLIKQVQQPKQTSAQTSPPPPAVLVKLHPGYELVSRQDKVCEAITTNGANLAVTVAAQDHKLKTVTERCEAELAAWKSLQGELNSMGTIVDSIDSLRAEMEALCGQLEHLDIALDGHIQAKEHKDMVQWKREINRDTEAFQASRSKELVSFEKTLKAEQNKRLKQKAEEEARALKEAEMAKRKEAKAKADEELQKAKDEARLAEKQAKEELRKARDEILLAKKQKEQEAREAKASKEKATVPVAATSDDINSSSVDESTLQNKNVEVSQGERTTESAIASSDQTSNQPTGIVDPQEPAGEELEVDESVMNAIEEKEKDP